MTGSRETADADLLRIYAIPVGIFSYITDSSGQILHRLIHERLSQQIIGGIGHYETVIPQIIKRSGYNLSFLRHYTSIATSGHYQHTWVYLPVIKQISPEIRCKLKSQRIIIFHGLPDFDFFHSILPPLIKLFVTVHRSQTCEL
jgi:hypothetical protein